MDRGALIEHVDQEFAGRVDGCSGWPDPWPDHGDKPQEAYSRVTDAGRYRIVGARADVWRRVVTRLGWCTVGTATAVDWAQDHRGVVARSDRWIPTLASALALVVDRTEIDGEPVGVTLGAGRPAALVERFPECGCDACDSGSQAELDHLDRHVLGVVSGTYRRLERRGTVITVLDDEGWSMGSSGRPQVRGRDVPRVLDDPTGWSEVSGSAWWPEPR